MDLVYFRGYQILIGYHKYFHHLTNKATPACLLNRLKIKKNSLADLKIISTFAAP